MRSLAKSMSHRTHGSKAEKKGNQGLTKKVDPGLRFEVNESPFSRCHHGQEGLKKIKQNWTT